MAAHTDEVAEADTQEAPLQPLVSPEITDSPPCVVSATPSRVFKVFIIMKYFRLHNSNTFVETVCSTVCFLCN